MIPPCLVFNIATFQPLDNYQGEKKHTLSAEKP